MTTGINRRSYLKASGLSLGGLTAIAGCAGGGGGYGESGGDGDGGSGGGAGGGGGGRTTWRFATSAPGTPAVAWVNGFAKIAQEETDSLRLEPVTSASFASALVDVQKGNAEVGISDMGVYHAMRLGTAPFEEAVPAAELPQAIIPSLHISGHWIAGRASEGIETLEDLDGINYSHWDQGSAGNSVTDYILEQAGVSLGSTEYEDLGGTQSSVMENRVDGWTMFIINNYLHPGPEVDTAEQVEHTAVPVPEDIQQGVEEEFRGWKMERVQTDRLNLPVTGSHVDVWFKSSNIYAHPDADPATVKLLTETMLNNIEAIGEIHPGLKLFGFGEAPDGIPFDERHGFTGVSEDVTFHPGAIEYFEENNIDYPGA